MANYTNLKSTINAQIRQNGTGAITGPVLNGVLRDMVSALGEAGYLYKGVATPATSPGTPDSNVFYIASTAGTYTNFGGAVVADGEVAILKYNGTWTKEVTGAATAAQVTQLGRDVEDIVGGIFPLSPSMTWGYITNGTVAGSTHYKHSEPIHLNEGEKIIVVTAGYSFDSISQTNESGTSYSRLVIGNSTATVPKTYEYIAPADMYVAACCNIEHDWSISIEKIGKAPSREEYTDLEELVGINTTILNDKAEAITPTWVNGYRKSADLTLNTTSSSQKRSNPIPLSRGSVFRYSTPSGVSTIAMVTEVDASGNPLQMILKGIGNNQVNQVDFFATKDTYIEVCAYSNVLANTSVLIYSSESLKAVLADAQETGTDINLGSLLWKDTYTIDGNTGQQVANNNACMTWYGIPSIGINWLVLNKVQEDATRTYTVRVAYYGDNDSYLGYKDYALGEQIRPPFSKYFRLALYTTLNGSATGQQANANLANLVLNICSSSTDYHYVGERITVCPKVSWKILANTSYNGRVQGGDCYGNILVQFHSQDLADYPLCGLEIIDLSTGQHLQQIQLGYEDGVHNNGVSFGPERYDPDDQFPLIYASVMFGARDVYVYRLTVNNGVYSITKVQTIHLLPVSVYNDINPTCFIDKRGFLYSEGEILNDTSNGMYIKYRLPSISEGSDVQLTTDDVLDHFVLPVSDPFGGITSGGEQDGTIIGNKLYQVFGFSNSSWINCIDLDKKGIISSVSFQQLTLDSEPEAVFPYSDMLGVSFNGFGGMIVGLDFNP